MISDFAVFTAICVMVFVDFMVGLDTDKLKVPANLRVVIDELLLIFIYVSF